MRARIVDRPWDNTEAAYLSGSSERRARREKKERTRMALSLVILADRKQLARGSGVCFDQGNVAELM